MELGTEAQKEYFQCNLFEKKEWRDFENPKGFEVAQLEILANPETHAAEYLETTYTCSFSLCDSFDPAKPQIIICIRDNAELLEYTLNNLTEYKIFDLANVTIVDDRSERDIKSVSDKFECSYLRVDNSKGFSFSMLNNIPAYIYHQLDCRTIVLWNSDLWAHDSTTFRDLLELHFENKSQISGTKLLYPTFRWDGKEGETQSVVEIFKGMEDRYRGTVQFGGGAWWAHAGDGRPIPLHAFRFGDKDHPAVNSDKGDTFVTGAFQIIDLNWFVESGGLNPSMPRLFQDVDLCLRADRIFYFGKNRYFIHDESLSQPLKEKQDKLYVNDHLLFNSIWGGPQIRPQIGLSGQ